MGNGGEKEGGRIRINTQRRNDRLIRAIKELIT